MVITGLRGVGKTVLLNEFRGCASVADWAVVEMEISKHDDAAFRRVLGREVRKALFEISPSTRWKDKARRAASALKAFTVQVSPEGGLTGGLDVDQLEGLVDSGMLDADVTDLLVALGEAAADHETGVVFLMDEIQFLSTTQLEAFIAALHRTVQRSLPITLVAAGLPQIPELAGEAKSYSERLFKFPSIGQLSDVDAERALAGPVVTQRIPRKRSLRWKTSSMGAFSAFDSTERPTSSARTSELWLSSAVNRSKRVRSPG